MCDDKRVVAVDKYEYGIIVNALNDKRTELMKEERPTDAVDEVMLKVIDAPKKRRGRHNDAAR